MNKFKATKILSRATGLNLRQSLDNIHAIMELAETGCLLPGSIEMDGPKGRIALGDVYLALAELTPAELALARA